LLWLLLGRTITGGAATYLRAGEASRYAPDVLASLRATRSEMLWESVLLGLLWICGFGLILELRRRGRLAGWLAALGLAALVLADLAIVDRKFYDPQPRRVSQASLRPDAVIRFLQDAQPPFRVAPLYGGRQNEFSSNRYAAFGIETIGGYQPAKLRIYNDLIESGAIYSPQVLAMLNVHYILYDESLAAQGMQVLTRVTDYAGREVVIHKNPFVMPRAWFVPRARSAPDAPSLIAAIADPSFDPWETAWFLESEGGLLPDSLSAGRILIDPVAGVVDFRADDPRRVVLPVEVDGPEPGLLVLSEIFYEPGWRVMLDGGSAGTGAALRFLRANYALRALLVPPGRHEIEIRAVSPGLERGRRLSRASALGVVGLFAAGLLVARLARRRRPA
jgi:hypothetical protein